MAIRRFFYVTQDSLAIWNEIGRELTEEISFPSSDEGFKSFSSYLERASRSRSLMVVDVIEEEFDTDAIPQVSGSDRKNLIQRRLKKRFPRTPYRFGVFLGGRRRASDSFNVVYTAITNHDLVDPWLEIIERHKLPLVGVTSVPLISVELLKEFRSPAENSMFITQHQGGRLRMVFIKSGQPVSARLSRDLPSSGEGFGAELIAEIDQSRKYLERTKRIGADDPLDVYFITDEEVAKTAFADGSRVDFRAHIIDSTDAARQLGIAGTLCSENLESLYLARCARKRPRCRYVLPDRIDYSRLLSMRHATISAAVAGAIACSVAVGVLLSAAWVFRGQSQLIEAQISQMEETFRRENEEFEPMRADSHEMKFAVDTSDYILKNSLPFDWVLGQVGRVMDGQPDMHIGRLSWNLVAVADANDAKSRRNGNDRNVPVPIPEVTAITAKISGEIHPYDGDLRHAFEKIDRLASSLQKNTAFERVAVAEYPIDASPDVAVSGEIRRHGENQLANFQITLTLRIGDEAD